MHLPDAYNNTGIASPSVLYAQGRSTLGAAEDRGVWTSLADCDMSDAVGMVAAERGAVLQVCGLLLFSQTLCMAASSTVTTAHMVTCS